MDLELLNEQWKTIGEEYLSALNDKVTVYRRPLVSGNTTGYSTYYGDSLDYESVLVVSGFGNQEYETHDLYGEIYLNVYGWSYSNNEEVQRLPVGNIQPNDVLFVGLAKDVLLNSGDPGRGTYFDGIEYVVVEKDNQKYVPVVITPSGMDEIYYYYVLLRRTDRQPIQYNT